MLLNFFPDSFSMQEVLTLQFSVFPHLLNFAIYNKYRKETTIFACHIRVKAY